MGQKCHFCWVLPHFCAVLPPLGGPGPLTLKDSQGVTPQPAVREYGLAELGLGVRGPERVTGAWGVAARRRSAP